MTHSNWRLRFSRIGFSVLFLLPVAWSVSNSISPSPQRNILERREHSALAFEEYLIDRHEIGVARKSVVARFRFLNRSKNPIRIDAIRPSCGCVTVRLAKRDYAPGEEGEFYLQVDTANEESGPKEYTAEITCTGKKTDESRVKFRVVLPEKKLTVRPRALIFYHFADKASTQELMLTEYRNRSLEITKVEGSAPYVHPIPGETTKDQNGNAQSSVYVTITKDVPVGRHRASVTIHTTDSDYPHIKVPLMIERMAPPKALTKKTAASKDVIAVSETK